VADHYRQFSVAVRLHGKLATAWVTDTLRARRRQWQQLVEADEHGAADEVGIDFDWSIDDEGYLCLTDDDGGGSVEHVVEFLRELMRVRYVHEPVAIQWADTCSKHRPDEFTGGAVVVTRRRVHWFVLPEIVERKLRAIEQRKRA
jgi:hypothetical protein